MKRTENWLFGMMLLLALIVVLEWVDIRILRATIAVEEQRINNYLEECGDRTDAPHPACGHDADGAATSSGGAECTNQ